MRKSHRNWRSFGATALTGLIGTVLFYSQPDVMADQTTVEAIKQTEDTLASGTVSSLEELAGRLRSEQEIYRILMPPDADFTLRQPCGMVFFDPKSFPDTFTAGLIGEQIYDCPVYTLILAEDPITREIVLANADGKEIAAVKPETGYNPYWYFQEQYPDLYPGLYSDAEIKALKNACDPYHIQITLTLLPTDYVTTYSKAVAEEQATAAATATKTSKFSAGGGISPMMMYQGPAVSDLTLVGIERATNGMKLTLAYPSDYTNRVDFFTCPDLIGFWWNLGLSATNVNSSTNWIEWTDVNATAQTVRFYAAGNADLDSDGDGLTDAKEKYMYHTSSITNDTDGDGLSDYEEVINLHTDPNNNDTNKPNVWISYPANGSRKVWLP